MKKLLTILCVLTAYSATSSAFPIADKWKCPSVESIKKNPYTEFKYPYGSYFTDDGGIRVFEFTKIEKFDTEKVWRLNTFVFDQTKDSKDKVTEVLALANAAIATATTLNGPSYVDAGTRNSDSHLTWFCRYADAKGEQVATAVPDFPDYPYTPAYPPST